MKISRCFYLVALVFGLCGMAKADTIDFKMTVLDPGNQLNYTQVTGAPFDVSFGGCPMNIPAAPMGTPQGCFTGLNVTNETFTSLDLIFNNNPVLNNQPANCDTSASKSLFANAVCSDPTTGNNVYNLQFSGGTGIAPGAFFFIVEDGVKPKDFGTGTGYATPEPSSVLLLLTGVIMMGGAFLVNRKRTFLR